LAVRAVSLDAQSLWRDEVDALRFATAPWAEMLANLTRPGWNGPLYFLLLRGWIALTGTSEYALRFFSLAFGTLCVPLAYVLGRRLFDPQVGFLAALLMAASPYLTWYGQEVKMYTLVPALALLALYGLRRAVEGSGWHWWAVQVIATSLAFYSHILAALLIPVQVLCYFAWWPQARRQWIGALASLACLTLPYLPLAAWQAPLVLQVRETGFYPYTLGEMAEILLNGWSTGILTWGWPWGAVLMGALAVWGLVSPPSPPPPLTGGGLEEGSTHPTLSAPPTRGGLGEGSTHPTLSAPPTRGGLGEGSTHPTLSPPPTRGGLGEGRARLALLGWLVIPLLAVWLVSLRQPLFTDRYLVWTAPAFCLLVALGLVSLYRLGERGCALPRMFSRVTVVLLAGAILVVNGVNLWQQATLPIKSDFRAAATYLSGHYTPGELIVFQIPYGRYTFDYYFPPEAYPWAEGLYTNHRAPDGSYLMNEQEAAYRMQEMTEGYNVVWLVVTEMEMWDQRGLVKAWLEAHMHRADEAHFARVDVYRYVKRET
jgi:hypothetical protein